MPTIDPLLQPFALKGVSMKNRVVSTSHAPAYADDGKPKERYQRYHEEKARGGIGMTMFGGSSCVAPDSPPVFGQLYVGDDSIIAHFQQFAERIHAHDCRLICQLSHLGRRTAWNTGDWLPVMAPSRVREPAHRGFPKVMDKHDIRRAVDAYAQAALRCREGQLDGCELLSHGHLLEQFLSPATNRRSDAYGGSFDNRLRFTLEVIEAVREAVGDDFIVGIRLVAKEDFAGGLTLDEGIAAAQRIERSGFVDFLNVNFGHIDTDHALAHHVPAMWSGLAPWLGTVAEFRREVNLPLVHACRIADLASARYAISENIVDLVAMTRAHIADPHIVNKLMRGEEELIRPCVGAGYCLDRIYEAGEALCLHNAATGREQSMPHVISRSGTAPRKAVVIGGGPAGLEAARVLSERGHRVVLFEAAAELGGQVAIAARANWRRDLIGIIDWLRSQLERLRVDVRWNTLADADDVLAEEPDIVIVATGGIPDSELVPGGDLCLSTWEVLSGGEISGSVLVYDDNGQHQGPSCADYLSDRPGVDVEIVTPDRAVAIEMGALNYPIFLQHFYAKGVKMTPDHRLTSVTREDNRLRAEFSNEFGQRSIHRVVDHVVVEHGTLPADELYWSLRDSAANEGVTDYPALLAGREQPSATSGFVLFRVGDAVSSRNIHAAIYDSLRLCKDL